MASFVSHVGENKSGRPPRPPPPPNKKMNAFSSPLIKLMGTEHRSMTHYDLKTIDVILQTTTLNTFMGGFWNSWLHFAPRKYAFMIVSVADNLLNLKWILR